MLRIKTAVVFIFIAFLFLENTFHLSGVFKAIATRVYEPSMKVRDFYNRVTYCFSNVGRVGREEVKPSEVISYVEGVLVVRGSGEKYDYVLTRDGNFVGYVIRSLDGLVYVNTPFSSDFAMRISLVSEKGVIEGMLTGGDPPLIEVPEEVNVDGWDVWVSEEEPLGWYLRKSGLGYLGKIRGKMGKFWILDYRLPEGNLKVVGM